MWPFDAFKGYRWSLYLVKNQQSIYVMHENSVMTILGYVMPYYENGKRPDSIWKLILIFNKSQKSIELEPSELIISGNNVETSSSLIRKIELVDPSWMVRGSEPVFEECSTKRRIPLSSKIDFSSSASMMKSVLSSSSEETFDSILRRIFK